MYYLGIDLHKDESHVTVLDDDAEVIGEIRVVNANLDEVAEVYAGAKATLEATSNYDTVYDTLDEHLDMVVADPNQTKATGYAKVKNNRLDAKLLVQLRWAGMIGEGYVRPKSCGSAAYSCAAGGDLVGSIRTSKMKSTAYSTNHGISYDWDPFSVNGREILSPRHRAVRPMKRLLAHTDQSTKRALWHDIQVGLLHPIS